MKAPPLRIDERNHVEKPLLDQLAELGWEILDLDNKQRSADSFRESFAEVVMLPVLRGRLKVINPWLEEDQIEEAVKLLTDGFPGTGLIENNRRVLDLLLENTSVGENRRTGERSPTVRFVDFEQRENNRFIAVCQFKVRIPGTEHHVIPDIVLFLNGLPVVVVECKSPKVKDAIPEAIDQLLRYGDQRGARGEGSARLFHYNQFLVATCRQEAKFGTITTRGEKDFYRWADPYPRTVDNLEHGAGGPNDQQRLVAGMLDDRYTMRQSIEDGVTLRIVYEGRTHTAEVPDRAAMDTAFEDVFNDYDLQERLQILGYGSRDAYLEAESTIEAKARDMVEHYLTHVYPNGYKAQVVATSREAAVRYKTHIDAALRIVVAKVELDDDPDLKASFAQALADIFEHFRDNWQKIYEELEKLRTRILGARKGPTYGLHRKKQMPFFRMFRRELFGMGPAAGGDGKSKTKVRVKAAERSPPPYEMSEDSRVGLLVDLTQKVFLAVERELKLTGFRESTPARNRLKAEIQRTLLAPEFVSVRRITGNRARLISRIMEIAEKNNDIILYAD